MWCGYSIGAAKIQTRKCILHELRSTINGIIQSQLTTNTTNTMSNLLDKPSPEAKALSLYLMAYKNTSPVIKEKYKRIKKQWSRVLSGEISTTDYTQEVQDTLTSYGGYAQVIEKTVKFYIDKTGQWSLQGDDQYCVDAQKVADEILKEGDGE